MSLPTAITVPAVAKHTATIIMAHGLGDSGQGWVSLAQNWRRRQKFDEVKFIFPSAPNIPITVVCLVISCKVIATRGRLLMKLWYRMVA